MSVLLKALSALTPPTPQPLSRDYDGLEYKWKMFGGCRGAIHADASLPPSGIQV